MAIKIPRNTIIISSIVIFILLLAIAVYYFNYVGDIGRRTDLVGDGVCGNLITKKGQDDCCARLHKDDAVIECVGKWQYVNGPKECQFICEGSEPACTEELKQCSDGSYVGRNASLDCKFNSCPN